MVILTGHCTLYKSLQALRDTVQLKNEHQLQPSLKLFLWMSSRSANGPFIKNCSLRQRINCTSGLPTHSA